MNTKRARWTFIFVSVVMVIQFAIYLKGSEPYPALIHPSFSRIPEKSGVQWFTRTEVIVHFTDGGMMDVNYQKIFNRVQPWFVPQILKTLEQKGRSTISDPKKVELGIYTFELRRYATRREDQYAEFKEWLKGRVIATTGRSDVLKVEFNRVQCHYDMNDTPIRIERGSTENVETVFL